MSNANKETIVTRITSPEHDNWIFASYHELTSEEKMELARKYLGKHHELTLPGDCLFVDLRPAAPEFRSVRKDYDPLSDQ